MLRDDKKMKIKSFLIASLAAFSLTAGAQSLSPNTKWHWDKGTIVVETPERPAGQHRWPSNKHNHIDGERR